MMRRSPTLILPQDSPDTLMKKKKLMESTKEVTFLDKLTDMSIKVRNFQEVFEARRPFYMKESESKKKLRIMEEQRKVARMKMIIQQ